jgi:hypothetical protein
LRDGRLHAILVVVTCTKECSMTAITDREDLEIRMMITDHHAISA